MSHALRSSEIIRSVDFFVVGAQKCATSWLYYCLRDHPDLHLPPDKEEEVYLGGKYHRQHGDEWFYRRLGRPSAGQKVGDVSVDYIFDPRSPAAVHDHNPDAKIVAILRNPVDRAISAYFWHLRRGNVEETDVNTGLRACLHAVREQDADDSYVPEAFLANVVLRGLYDIQIERYAETFAAENLLVLPYEKISTSEAEVVEKLYRFLSVDPEYEPNRVRRHQRPKQNSYLTPLLRFERDTPNHPVFDQLANAANQLACRLGLDQGRPSLSPNVRNALQAYYEESVHRTFAIIRDLPASKSLWNGVSWGAQPFDSLRNSKVRHDA
jgi:hypothetical protein